MNTKTKEFLVKFIATGYGSGYAPIIPGTFGTLAAFPIFWAMTYLIFPVYIAVTVIISLIGIWAAGEAEKLFGVKDPHPVVIDEIAGLLTAMLFLPFQIKYLLIAFVIFRVFDVLKPWPCFQIQSLDGGWGIMLDDLIAGLYTGGSIWLFVKCYRYLF